jgi:hypothetical protein
MTLRSILALALILYPSARASGQIPAGMKVGLSQYLQNGYDGLKANVVAAANKMPEADFGFRPSTMPEDVCASARAHRRLPVRYVRQPEGPAESDGEPQSRERAGDQGGRHQGPAGFVRLL